MNKLLFLDKKEIKTHNSFSDKNYVTLAFIYDY